MEAFPHLYQARATADAEGDVLLHGEAAEPLASAPPAQFGGPGDRWSPESLLAAAVADCFVLSFRAIARASKLGWHRLDCEVEGTLDRVERATRFTRFEVRAELEVPAGTDEAKARRLLEKAEASCLITNSLSVPVHLETRVATT